MTRRGRLHAPPPNWLDRAIRWVAPEVGLRRAAARMQLARLRRYEAAAVTRRTSGWHAGQGSPNAEIGPSLHLVRARVRQLVRDNCWAARACRHLQVSATGSGGVLATPIGSRGISDRKLARIDERWKDWSGTVALDPAGQQTFAGIQSLTARSAHEAGEVLVRRIHRSSRSKLPIPMQLQVIEADFLDTAKTEQLKGGNLVLQGVEYDRGGRRVAYWLFPVHPGESIALTLPNLVSERVSADDVIHVYEPLRPGQVRGISAGAPAAIRHRDFDEYEDATLVRAKIAALTVAFIRNPDGQPSTSNVDEIEELRPGGVEYLAPGEDVTFNNPPAIMGYEDYARVSLRAVAAGWDVSYESLTGDLSQVNFASGRLGWISENRRIEAWRRQVFVPQVCQRVWSWFLEGAALAGDISATDLVRAEWTPPRREMIQPDKEINALRVQIGAGLLSPSEALRQLGYDPKRILEELADDLELMRDLGITPDLMVKLTSELEDEQEPGEPPVPDSSEGRALVRNGARAMRALARCDGGAA